MTFFIKHIGQPRITRKVSDKIIERLPLKGVTVNHLMLQRTLKGHGECPKNNQQRQRYMIEINEKNHPASEIGQDQCECYYILRFSEYHH